MFHRVRLIAWLISCLIFPGCGSVQPATERLPAAGRPTSVASPSGRVVVEIDVSDGAASYRVRFDGHIVIDRSSLGLVLRDAPLGPLEAVNIERTTANDRYDLPVGKTSHVREHANVLTLSLRETRGNTPRQIEVEFRACDDGVAFRYRLPKQPALGKLHIIGEDTAFAVPADTRAWALPLPAINSHYEFDYLDLKVEQLAPGQLIGMPLLLHLSDGPYAAILEAGLTDYAGMALSPDGSTKGLLRATLAPKAGTSEVAIGGNTPFATPWRVVLVGDSMQPLIESNLVTSLNGPSRVGDTSWIKPGKVSFLWWNGYVAGLDAAGKPVRGGVDTATCVKYVDFAADNGIPYASLDGLDVAWYGGPLAYNGQDLTTGHAPNLDVQAVLAHAKDRGVRIRLWMDSKALRPQLDKALAAFEQWGVEGIMVDFIEREDQDGVRWIAELAEKAAKHHLTVSLHNVPKPSGLSRTYPNLLTYEAVRNQEWNKFDAWGSKGSRPRHEVTVPFTRMLAGPLDFHSGGFRSVLPRDYVPRDFAPLVMGTRAHQVAMYVVYEDPLPMVVDYPEAYRGQPEFKLLTEIPTTWDETRFLAGNVGQDITIARRRGDVWYVGSMAGDEARSYRLPLTFLGGGRYTVDGFRDGPAEQPNKTVSEPQRELTRDDFLDVRMSPAGGHVVRLRPVSK